MAEEKMMRLSLAARKLNVSIVTVTEILGSKGHRIDSNPNAKLTLEQLGILAKEYNNSDLLGETTGTGFTESEPTRFSSSDDDILYFRETQPVKEDNSAAPKPEPKAEEPEIIRIEHNLQGPKVLGKIDLNPKAKVPVTTEPEKERAVEEPKIEKAEEKPAAAEPAVVVTPEPVQVPKEEVVKPEPEVQAPVPVIEKPVVDVPKKEEPKQEEVVPAKPEVTSQPEAAKEAAKTAETVQDDDSEDSAPEEVLPPKLIKAQGEKLQGLKVLGKIELPVEKKPLSKEELKKKRKRKRVVVAEKVNPNAKDAAPADRNKDRKPEPGRPADNNRKGPGTPQGGNNNNAQGNNSGGNSNSNSQNSGNNNRRGGKDRKEAVSQTDVKDSIKQTMAKMQSKGPDFGAKYRREKRKTRAEQQDQQDQQDLDDSGILKVTEFISASELSSLMDVSVNEVISTCMKMGIFVSINQRLDAETIQMIALEFNYDVEFISAEEDANVEALEIVDEEADLKDRAPIVTIMGHVDHGKTSLLDYIRRTKVASGEAGGITQHIGAYSVKIKEGSNKGKSITFLDTPGHEAFTAMRARGAKITDVVIIVISADDSVMPQTREAINHAQNAGVPIVFALNKIDKPGANPEKIRQDLSKENILVESWGGKFQEQEVSAKSGIGIDDLLDKVLLEAELLELKANPNRAAVGSVIEAELDKGRGYVSTVLVQNGTLKVGDIILAGQYFGRVRAMVNDIGERIKEAGPGSPVQILGIPGAPQAGDKFNVMETDREAREIANKREQIIREQSIRAKKHITLDEIGRRKAIGTFKELNVIVKGDVDGSVEALSDSLLKLSTDEVQVRIIHKAVGQISESDVTLASAADAIVIGFQVRPSNNARKIADAEQIEIRLYSIIYDAINEIKAAMEGMLAPKEEEVIMGNIEIREVFKISKLGTVAGCYVLDGVVKRNNKVRIVREGIVVHEGEIAQLKRFKDDVAEVKTGYECGLSIKNFNDIQIGDVVESFEIKEVKRKLA